MYLARNAPPRTARKVASACPTIAPPATPHGDCSQEVLEETIHLDIKKKTETEQGCTCAAPRAIVASIERSPHS